MRKLDENCVYYLLELTSEEQKELWIYLTKVNEAWAGDIERIQFFECDYLYFCFDWVEKGEWLVSRTLELIKNKQVTNAKELFYTLENVQVDCREVQPIHIHNMANVVVNQLDPTNKSFDLRSDCTYFSFNKHCNLFGFYKYDKQQYEITYEKFMELFGKEESFKQLVEVLNEELTEEAYKGTEYEVTMIAEQPNDFKQITDSIASLLQYKNEKYGNSALEPLDVFNGKSKVGQRIDDKLARVKNSKELRKNDIADLLGYLTLVCQEKNWTNFDEFKD